MDILNLLLYYIQWIFLIVIGIQVLYFLIFSLAGLFPYRPVMAVPPLLHKKNKIAVIIPGYKEDRIIIDTAKKALQQNYPKEHYEVLIMADSFREDTLATLQLMDVRLIPVQFVNSTKAKSINRALQLLSSTPPDIVVILDSDNIMAPDFLEIINAGYNSGFIAMQGHRTAKNSDTSFAFLDALNEEIGNNIFRKGHRVLGISSALIGSGMAFDFNYFQELMSDIEDVAGEDKLIELKILKAGVTIEYFPHALVYDEKVSTGKNFSKQRTRWVGVQLYFLKNYFFSGLREFFLRGNLPYLEKVFQMFLIPKVLLIGILGVMAIVALLGWVNQIWFFMAIAYFAAIFLAIPGRYYNKRLLRATLNIPSAIIFMVLGILKIRKSTASKFEVTEKGTSK